MTFLGLTATAAAAVDLLKITLRFTSLYGNHLSMITFCGLLGNGASLSMTTFLGGGGNRLPEMVILFGPTGIGGCGGASRMINGSGVSIRGGCWRIITGGAGGKKVFGY